MIPRNSNQASEASAFRTIPQSAIQAFEPHSIPSLGMDFFVAMHSFCDWIDEAVLGHGRIWKNITSLDRGVIRSFQKNWGFTNIPSRATVKYVKRDAYLIIEMFNIKEQRWYAKRWHIDKDGYASRMP